MALNGSMLGKLMLAQCLSKGLRGTMIPPFCAALGEGVVTSFKAMNIVQTVDIGVLTVGTGIGKMSGLMPMSLLGMALPLMAGGGIIGIKSKDLMEALCKAAVMHFNTMNQVSTVHTTVALGTGIGKVSGLIPTTMIALVVAKMASKNIKGPQLIPLVKAFCTALCNNIMATAIVQVAIAGAPAPTVLGVPIPSGGVGIGKVS